MPLGYPSGRRVHRPGCLEDRPGKQPAWVLDRPGAIRAGSLELWVGLSPCGRGVVRAGPEQVPLWLWSQRVIA